MMNNSKNKQSQPQTKKVEKMTTTELKEIEAQEIVDDIMKKILEIK